MKNILSIWVLIISVIACEAQQVYSLKSHTPTPEGAYMKDVDNDLPDYEGIWKGQWSNKYIYITVNKLSYQYVASLNQYFDFLVIRFKVTDLNGNILFDNTNLLNDKIKIEGVRFRNQDNKYLLLYNDIDLCNRSGKILINFSNSAKTQLQWHYFQDESFVDSDCFYFGWPQTNIPQPLPNDIIFTKQ